MNDSLIKILEIIIPVVLTIGGNIIFYSRIKSKIDKSIEKHKIAFSGVFKERIDIYREILRQIYGILFSLNRYQYTGTTEEAQKIALGTNEFINYCLINQMFLSENMLAELHKVREEFQFIFDNFFMHHSLTNQHYRDAEKSAESLKKFYEAANKLRGGNSFKIMETTIVKEMRADMRVDNL